MPSQTTAPMKFIVSGELSYRYDRFSSRRYSSPKAVERRDSSSPTTLLTLSPPSSPRKGINHSHNVPDLPEALHGFLEGGDGPMSDQLRLLRQTRLAMRARVRSEKRVRGWFAGGLGRVEVELFLLE